MEEGSIKRFYDGAEVFITGGTGYIGKVLIEKLLRTCQGIKTIYVLMRLKKASGEERIQKMTDSLLFEKLKATQPEAFKKVHPIEGDAMKLNLGLSESNLEKLKSCSVIFHAAASVRFDDPLKSAILLNTRGTREVCNLARSLSNLKALIHVSTAFIQPKNFLVEEKIYAPEGDWRDYIKYAENLDEDVINAMTLKLTHFAPNTYTFTKNMAEQVCIDYKNEFNLPIVIYRPSIVSATEFEPISCWCDNLNGPMGLILTGALGITHVTFVKGSQVMNMVPIDICIKGMLIASYKVWKDRDLREQSEIPIYNSASIKYVTYESFSDVCHVVRKYPSMQAIGLPQMTYTKCTYYAWIIRIFRNLIPALIIDGLLSISGNKPKLLKIQRLIFNAEQSLLHFSSNCFNIVNHKFIDLGLSIPEHEKSDFFLDEQFFVNCDLYKKTYLLSLQEIFKERPEDFPKARRRYFYVTLVIRTVHLITAYIALRMLSKVVLNFTN